MNMTTATCACLLVGLTSGGCETEQLMLQKSALTTELRKETTTGMALPAGCPTLIKSLPATQTSLTVSYLEPTQKSEWRLAHRPRLHNDLSERQGSSNNCPSRVDQ